MFKINNWKEPIDKDDLLYVIINGLISAVLCGILAGALNYLLGMVNINLDLGFIVLLMIIHWRIKNSFETNHILYAVIGLIALFIAFFISEYTTIAIGYVILLGGNPLVLLGNGSTYYHIIFGPILNIISSCKALAYASNIGFAILKIILSFLSLFLLIYAFYYTYISIRRKR